VDYVDAPLAGAAAAAGGVGRPGTGGVGGVGASPLKTAMSLPFAIAYGTWAIIVIDATIVTILHRHVLHVCHAITLSLLSLAAFTTFNSMTVITGCHHSQHM
jgi:hypothetical protein